MNLKAPKRLNRAEPGEGRILSREQMRAFVAGHKAAGHKIGLCHGCFDLVHPGHLAHFEACRAKCDVLIVTITADAYVKRGPGRPLFDEQTRAKFLSSIRSIDAIMIVHEPTAFAAIDTVEPNFYFKGIDYSDESKDRTGMITREREAVESHGGRLIVTETEKHSSTDLIKAARLIEFSPEVERFIEAVRKECSLDEILEFVEGRFAKLSMAVVGDLIIDEYITCTPVGTTSKSPTISAVYRETERMAGGSAAIARHLAEYVGEVQLTCQKGFRNWSFDDVMASSFPRNVALSFVENPQGYTPHKLRFLSSGYPNTINTSAVTNAERPTKLFEYAFINDGASDAAILAQEVEKGRLDPWRDAQALIWADFGHGLLSAEAWAQVSAGPGLKIVNVQTNSTNFGFNLASKYGGADAVCLDELEARLVFHDRRSPVEALVPRLIERLDCGELVVTRGSAGMLFAKDGEEQIAPALATRVIDPVGAGDAVLSLVALCRAANAPPLMTAMLASVAGAIACTIVGNREPVRKATLIKYLNGVL